MLKKNKKTKRRCGFCNSPSHNRKNCKLMKQFISDLASANQNYRKEFFGAFVEHHGVSEGALVEIRMGGRRKEGRMKRQIGIVQNIDWNSINLSLAINHPIYAGKLPVSVIAEGETLTSDTPFWYWLDNEYPYYQENELKPFLALNHYSDQFQILNVLSQSDSKPDQKWFTEGFSDGWEWVCKNKNLSELRGTFADLIEEWHPKKNTLALQARLKRYRRK